MKVKEIMTTELITLSPEMTIKEVAKTLYENGITGAPVVDGEKNVLGIVTENDLVFKKAKLHLPNYIRILDSILYLESPKHTTEELSKIVALKASEIMTKDVVTISPEDSIENLATLIKEKHINPIPVVEEGKLVGIASRADIIKLLTK